MDFNDILKESKLSTTCEKCRTKYTFSWRDIEISNDVYETSDKLFRVTKLITRCPGCGRYDVVSTYSKEL